jgi:hypothetical protein
MVYSIYKGAETTQWKLLILKQKIASIAEKLA